MKLLTLCLLPAASVLLAAEPPRPDPAKADLAKFAGKWKPVKIEGQHPLKVEGLRVEVKGDRLTLAGATEKPLEFALKLDPAAKPRAIDITFAVGTLLGIYEFDGDTLRVCYSELQESEMGRRPAEFTAPADSKRYLWTLKREK